MAHRSPLQKFSVAHADASLGIVSRSVDDRPDAPREYFPVDVVWQTRVIATFTRRRDAWRALKKAGYLKEGYFWRLVPAAKRPPLQLETIDVGDLLGEL